jgi:hypothetical protein
MGAFDTVSATASCPACGTLSHGEWQTKFFDPDFQGRPGLWFKAGERHPRDIRLSELEGVGEFFGWVALRPWHRHEALVVLSPDYDWYGCSCGAWLAPEFEFAVEPDPAGIALSLIAARNELLDAPQALARVHFANAEGLCWSGDQDSYRQAMAALIQQPEETRRARIRKLIGPARWPEAPGPRQAHPYMVPDQLTALTTCTACGETQQRWGYTDFLLGLDYGQSPPGALSGGRFDLGQPAPCSPLVRSADQHGAYLRLRPPHAGERLTVLTSDLGESCRCLAGPARTVQVFDLREGEAVLRRKLWRSLRGPAALEDIDWAHQSLLLPTYPKPGEAERLTGLGYAERRAALLQQEQARAASR